MIVRKQRTAVVVSTTCSILLGAMLAFGAGAGRNDAPEAPGEREVIAAMRRASVTFLDALAPELRKQATFELSDDERKAWSNLPATMFARKGVSFGELGPEQRVLAHRLIRSPLSSQGYLKAAGIMRVDEVLKVLAVRNRPEAGSMFGQEKYWIGIFGDPSKDEAWGWQLDGHHLALNFTVVGDTVSVTPAFLGSDPAEVRTDLDAGWYPLAHEDERGRRLYDSLDDGQRAKALLPGETPLDVIAGAGRPGDLESMTGLVAAEMTGRQRDLLRELLAEYLGNLDPDLAAVERARIEAAGFDKLRFAWSGTTEGLPYYYRIHGPTVLIEFDNARPPGNPQGSVNHIHTVWRSGERDYGDDLLRRHYATSPHHRGATKDQP